jgi:hypothetical protein
MSFPVKQNNSIIPILSIFLALTPSGFTSLTQSLEAGCAESNLADGASCRVLHPTSRADPTPPLGQTTQLERGSSTKHPPKEAHSLAGAASSQNPPGPDGGLLPHEPSVTTVVGSAQVAGANRASMSAPFRNSNGSAPSALRLQTNPQRQSGHGGWFFDDTVFFLLARSQTTKPSPGRQGLNGSRAGSLQLSWHDLFTDQSPPNSCFSRRS